MFRSFIAVVVIVSLTALTANAGLVGWWKLDETSGTDAADSSATGRTGTLSGDLDGDEWSSVDGEVAGLGGALQFSGNDYVDLGSAAGALNPADGPFTIAAWMKVTNGSNRFNSAFGFGDCCGAAPVRHAIEFGLEATGPQRSIYSIDSRGGGGDEMELLHPMGDSPVDRWVHMVATREDDGTASVYMRSTDGAINTSGTTASVTGMLNPTNGVSIGRTPFEGGDRYAQALIADVQFYHQALSAAEVTQLFDNPGTAIPEPSTLLLSLLAMSAVFGFRRIR